MEALLTGFYIFIGIVAGTVINILVESVKEGRQRIRLLKAAIKELRFDVGRIELNLVWLQEYRTAISTDSPQQFLKWFSLTSTLSVVTNQLLSNGVLYEVLSFEDITLLQGFFSFHSAVAEKRINDQAANQRSQLNKQEAANEIQFWDTRFKEQKSNLERVIARLEAKTA